MLQDDGMWLWMTRDKDKDDDCDAEDEGACPKWFLYDFLLEKHVFLKCVILEQFWLVKHSVWENQGSNHMCFTDVTFKNKQTAREGVMRTLLKYATCQQKWKTKKWCSTVKTLILSTFAL